MLIFLYIMLIILVLAYQAFFMFKPMFLNFESKGKFCLFISWLLAVPIIIIGGWKHLLYYLIVSVIAYIIGLVFAGILWRFINKKYFDN